MCGWRRKSNSGRFRLPLQVRSCAACRPSQQLAAVVLWDRTHASPSPTRQRRPGWQKRAAAAGLRALQLPQVRHPARSAGRGWPLGLPRRCAAPRTASAVLRAAGGAAVLRRKALLRHQHQVVNVVESGRVARQWRCFAAGDPRRVSRCSSLHLCCWRCAAEAAGRTRNDLTAAGLTGGACSLMSVTQPAVIFIRQG